MTDGKWIGNAGIRGAALGVLIGSLAACSGSTEDVRVTLCKNLTSAQLGSDALEWAEPELAFKRPEYAITRLRYAGAGAPAEGTSACYFAYEALDDTAVNLANPITAYATLPFAMSLDGRVLSDAETLQAVNAEQRRLGRQALDTLHQGARDLAAKVRGLGG